MQVTCVLMPMSGIFFLKKNNVIRRYQAGKITEFAIEKYN